MQTTPAESWSPQECELILKTYSIKGEAILPELNHRSSTVTSIKAGRMGIQGPRPLSAEENQLIERYADTLGDAMCFLLPGRSLEEVSKLCARSS